jgi:2-polyprenyl-6-methoxyphenol hydroxylase-like FAD-dependent oxidoreductase
VLIGDAAHAGPPTLAQGAAMGIEDAVVLAECLASADDPEVALQLFMERRFARVRTIVDSSLTLSRAQMEPGGQSKMAEANQAAAAVLRQPF